MKPILSQILFFAGALAGLAQPSGTSAVTSPVLSNRIEVAFDPTTLREQHRAAIERIILEYLDDGRPSADAITAYQLTKSFADRQGIRMTKAALRTNDERNLGSALLMQRLEALGLGYDRIYRLSLSNR